MCLILTISILCLTAIEIDNLDAIKDNSLDVITLTNVLHHLKNPIAFLNRAASKLKSRRQSDRD